MFIKKILITNLTAILLVFTGGVDGFDVKFNKFINYYFIDQSVNWGELYIEGLDADFKAAVLAQKRLSGGHFDENLHCVIPNNLSQTGTEWKIAKEALSQLIGPISEASKQESSQWRNSSTSIKGLLNDAHYVSPTFKHDFQNIASQIDGIVSFGPDSQHIVKTEKSLIAKVNRDASDEGISIEEAVSKIGDTLRGTVIVDSLDKISQVVAKITEYAHQKGAKVAFKNLWNEDRDSGYVGVHAKILYPLTDQDNTIDGYILAEMQIHLDNMFDGSESSAKERAHLIYENVRDEKLDSIELSAASKLLFLTAMEEILVELKSQ